MSTTHTIDKLDKAILRRLQANGRETYDVIGEQVGLSPSAVLRRVKRLEESGVIDRYVALVQPETVGLGLRLNLRLGGRATRGRREERLLGAAARRGLSLRLRGREDRRADRAHGRRNYG